MLYKPGTLHSQIALLGDLQAAEWLQPDQRCLWSDEEMLSYLLDHHLSEITTCMGGLGSPGLEVMAAVRACVCTAVIQHVNRCSVCVCVNQSVCLHEHPP